jgi:voltage-gated potassium channel
MPFAAELIASLWVVPNRLKWLTRHPLEVAVVMLTPPFLPASLQALRAIRVLRVLRLLRLGVQVRRMFTPTGVRYAAFLALLTVLGGGAAYSAMEDKPTIWSGLYWAVTTITTVGYGDVSPATDGGRVLAVAVMLIGIGFVAVLTGAIAQRFITPAVQDVGRDVRAIDSEEDELLREVRDIGQRLQRLERRLAERRS